MTLVHVDTDLGRDVDDLCAVAMLLGWPGVELAGVTTSAEEGGMRAGLTSYALRLAGRRDVSVVAGAEGDMGRLGREHPELPDDLLNFPYDPLVCAVAVGWDSARVEELELGAREEDGVLTFPEEPGGRKTRVVTEVDGTRFEEEWLRAVVSVEPDS